MEILVTGATGFIGRAVTQLLVERGDRVRALVRSTSDRSYLEGLDVDFHIGDVTDRGSIAIAAKGVEAVVHTAAWVSFYSRELEDMRLVNVTGVENVVSAALEVGARRVVHVSSIVAIGARDDGNPVDETFTAPRPRDEVPYLTTKREAEQIAFRYAKMGMEVVVVNPCLVVGVPDPRPVDPAKVLKFLRRDIPFRIRGGANYVDVWDVAHGIVAALERGRSGERYILGGENLTFKEVYDILEELSGVPAPRIPAPWPIAYGVVAGLDRLEQWTGMATPVTRQFIRVAGQRWFADSSKARHELDLPHTPIRHTLAQAIAYYRERGMV